VRSPDSKNSSSRDDEDHDVEHDHHPTTELEVLSRALSHRAGKHSDADVSIARSFVELHVPG
jgi:hypothetical protein